MAGVETTRGTVVVRRGADRGQFGFLEATDDPAVFSALFSAAEEWLAAEGARRIRGPCTPLL